MTSSRFSAVDQLYCPPAHLSLRICSSAAEARGPPSAPRAGTDIERLLGSPDVRQPVLVTDDRWIWWSFTFLDGPEYAPELRRQPVHLEITFACPTEPGPSRSHAAWRALGPLAVTYSKPSPSR
jgi:hypothetical protein